MELSEIRQEIDNIDLEIVNLIEQRMDLITKVTAYKKEHGLPVLDSQRESFILEKVAGLVENNHYAETVVNSFAAIMASSRDFQSQFIYEDQERGFDE